MLQLVPKIYTQKYTEWKELIGEIKGIRLLTYVIPCENKQRRKGKETIPQQTLTMDPSHPHLTAPLFQLGPANHSFIR